MAGPSAWAISGSYLESCNCEAICPCRRVGGRAGGRSTYGECLGALSWMIERGYAGDVHLSGLAAVLAVRYHDDEPGSPWTFVLYVDERGDDAQRRALVDILTGQLGGTPEQQFPWVWKESHLVGWRAVPIEVEHTPRLGWFRAGEDITVRVGEPVAGQETVTCVIPGHHRDGVELHGELLKVDADPLSFEFEGRCAYQSTFEYSG
jgi:hypothetical protein